MDRDLDEHPKCQVHSFPSFRYFPIVEESGGSLETLFNVEPELVRKTRSISRSRNSEYFTRLRSRKQEKLMVIRVPRPSSTVQNGTVVFVLHQCIGG